MNKIFQFIAQISLLIYPLALSRKISIQLDKIYTWRIMSSFKTVGGGKMQIDRKIKVYNGGNISVGSNLRIFKNCILATHPNDEHPTPSIIIGNGCEIGEGTHITCANGITIGNNFLTGRRCTITDNSHGTSTIEDVKLPPLSRQITSKGTVNIGNNVWLGDNVVVLPGVNIGDGAIVGASSVVSKDIPSYTVACGNPAKVLKTM